MFIKGKSVLRKTHFIMIKTLVLRSNTTPTSLW